MGDKKKQKFSLGDIIRKINEEKAEEKAEDSASQSTPPSPPAHSPDAVRAFSPAVHGPVLPSSIDSPGNTTAPRPPIPNHDHISGVAALPEKEHLHTKLDVPLYASASGTEEESADFDIMRYVGVLFRRKNIIILVAIIASIFSIFSYLKAVKFYTAHARMLFSPGGNQDIMGNNSGMYMYWDSREERLNTHLELLKSQIVLKRVAENLNNSVGADEISGSLLVDVGGKEGEKNDIVEVSFSHSNAEIARNVANELCKSYIEYIKEVNVQDVTRLIIKLDEQIGKVEKDLDQKENNLRIFKENNRKVELSSETNVTISKLSQMELALQQTQLDMLEGREKFTGLKKEIDQQQVDVIQSMTYQNPYQSRLAELELQLNTLSAEYSPEHFKVRMVKAEIDKIKNAMKSDITKEAASQTFVKNPIRQSLLQDLVNVTIEKSSMEAKRTAQEQLIKQLDTELAKLPSVELQYAQLTRETESLLQVLKLLKSRFEEAKIKRDSQESDLKILEWAQTPTAAISNVKFSKIFFTIFIGLLIGIAIAFLLEYLDQSIKEPPDVEKTLELPLLGIVPTIETDKAIIESSRDQGKTILEPFRALRANLKHIAVSRHIKTIIISSAVKGEGKTTLAANIAITLAMDAKKVILVDGDMRRAQIHGLFHLPKKNGLCDYLLGAAEVQDILKPTVHQNLCIITTGEHPQNPAELLGSYRFDQLIKDLRTMADYVIFDSPALLPVSDGITMAPKMDACIMVVRALWTPMKAARQAKNQLNRIGCTIIGAILNGISYSRGYYPYYYGYYRYYAYKYSYDEDQKSLFSMREFGLRAESKFKDAVQTIRLSFPRWVASSQSIARHLFRRKTFWLLLGLSIALGVLNTEKKHFSPGTREKQDITYLGEGHTSGQSAPNPPVVSDRDVAGALSSNPLAALKDSLALWQDAFNNKNFASYMAFYDSTRFQYPGGNFKNWETEIKNILLHAPSRYSIIHIDSVWTESMPKPYYKTFVNAKKILSGDTVYIHSTFIWQNSNYSWRIIREKQQAR
jgi:capsular exopolysaccharide family